MPCCVVLYIIIINEIYIALSLQVATQLRNSAANAVSFIKHWHGVNC